MLQIDHVYGGGHAHRMSTSPSVILREIRFSVERGEGRFQLLCANCNWRKRYENREYRENAGRPIGTSQTPEVRAQIAASVAASWTDPEVRTARVDGVHAAYDAWDAARRDEHAEAVRAGRLAEIAAMTPEERASFDTTTATNLAKGHAPRSSCSCRRRFRRCPSRRPARRRTEDGHFRRTKACLYGRSTPADNIYK